MTKILVSIVDRVSAKHEMTVLEKSIKQTPKTLCAQKVRVVDSIHLSNFSHLNGSDYVIHGKMETFESPPMTLSEEWFKRYLFYENAENFYPEYYAFDNNYKMYECVKNWKSLKKPFLFGMKKYNAKKEQRMKEFQQDKDMAGANYFNWKRKRIDEDVESKKERRKDYLKRIKNLRARNVIGIGAELVSSWFLHYLVVGIQHVTVVGVMFVCLFIKKWRSLKRRIHQRKKN